MRGVHLYRMLGAMALLAATGAQAAAVRLDDSLSSTPRVLMRQEWRDTFPVHNRAPDLLQVLARASTEIRLKTDAFVGRNARIFLVLPTTSNAGALPADLRMEWRTRGQMRAGAGGPGTRTLVYQGRINASITGDWFDFFLTADSRRLGSNVQFVPYFELETE